MPDCKFLSLEAAMVCYIHFRRYSKNEPFEDQYVQGPEIESVRCILVSSSDYQTLICIQVTQIAHRNPDSGSGCLE